MQAPANAPETERILRECDCPPWVERCAHFPDGRILGLVTAHPLPSTHSDLCAVNGDGFTVRFVGVFYCDYCGDETGVFGQNFYRDATTDASYHEALAAFHAAEETLLRGDTP